MHRKSPTSTFVYLCVIYLGIDHNFKNFSFLFFFRRKIILENIDRLQYNLWQSLFLCVLLDLNIKIYDALIFSYIL